MVTRRLVQLGILLISLLAAAACATAPNTEPAPAGTLPMHSLGTMTYYEDGKLMFLAVNSAPARRHLTEDWLPLEVAVANKSLSALTVNPEEGFRLKDSSGREFPAAPIGEMAKVRQSDLFDRTANPLQLQPVVQQRFGVYRFVAPNFGLKEGDWAFSRSIPLPKYAFTTGLILVKNPGDLKLGERYELWFSAKELKEPVFVGFVFGK